LIIPRERRVGSTCQAVFARPAQPTRRNGNSDKTSSKPNLTVAPIHPRLRRTEIAPQVPLRARYPIPSRRGGRKVRRFSLWGESLMPLLRCLGGAGGAMRMRPISGGEWPMEFEIGELLCGGCRRRHSGSSLGQAAGPSENSRVGFTAARILTEVLFFCGSRISAVP
jgi:hypothetical protein